MKTSAVAVVVVLAFASAFTEAAYVNYYDEDAEMECSNNQYMYHIGSVHSNHHEDRRWEFRCRQDHTSNCEWTNYVNDFDGSLAFTCPGNKVVTGIRSYHANHQEDRRFKFRCCDVTGKTTSNCYFTNFANNWDGTLAVTAPNGQVIKGATSEHNNHYEDRRWRFLLCNLQ